MNEIYLAGGLRNPWRQQVRDVCDGLAAFFDIEGLEFQQQPLQEIANTKMRMLDQATIVFAYLEKDNPSGLGMSAEIGYARKRGIPIFFIDERADKYSAFLRCLATYSTEDFQHALRYFPLWLTLYDMATPPPTTEGKA